MKEICSLRSKLIESTSKRKSNDYQESVDSGTADVTYKRDFKMEKELKG